MLSESIFREARLLGDSMKEELSKYDKQKKYKAKKNKKKNFLKHKRK